MTDPLSQNRYNYCNNNPVIYIDPSGHVKICEATSFIVGFIPIVGDVKDLQEAFLGIDVITGEILTPGERTITGILVIMPIVNGKVVRESYEVIGKGLTKADNLTGQTHHIISAKIEKALDEHLTLKGLLDKENPFFKTRAATLDDHKGYQEWHREYDAEVTKWLKDNPQATVDDFLRFLQEIYDTPVMREKFPSGWWWK